MRIEDRRGSRPTLFFDKHGNMAVDQRVTFVPCRPRYDGANIRTWIGFKQFMSLGTEAVLEWYRERGFGPQRLYHEFGLGLEVVDSSAQLPAVLEIDDDVVAEVVAKAPGTFQVRLRLARGGTGIVAMRGTLRVALVRRREARKRRCRGPISLRGSFQASARRNRPRSCPGCQSPRVLSRDRCCPPQARGRFTGLGEPAISTVTIPTVSNTRRMLARWRRSSTGSSEARGLSIERMLSVKGWIPVVCARVRVVEEARLGERIETTFEVIDLVGRLAYDAEMICYVRRGGSLVPTAKARILHGYALSRGPEAGRLIELDEPTLAALSGGRA